MTDGTEIVNTLTSVRNQLISVYQIEEIAHSELLQQGRVLLYQSDASFKEQLAKDASNDFFDEVDAPPWDTWFWVDEKRHISSLTERMVESGVLHAWIPEAFYTVAEAGIAAQPYGGLCWADEIEAALWKNGNWDKETELCLD